MTVTNGLTDLVEAAFARRVAPVEGLALEAENLSRAAREMAARFARGGRLLVFGNGGGTTDAQHIAVEFVHPVIVGKPALPALSLVSDVATLMGMAAREGLDRVYAQQVEVLGRPEDIALGLSGDSNVRRGLEAARQTGMLTVALVGADAGDVAADHLLAVASQDSLIVKEAHVTIYHLLWELVHVFLESPDTPRSDSGVESLYPFLYGGGTEAGSVLAAAAESVRQKVAEIVVLRAEAGLSQAAGVASCAEQIAGRLGEGGMVLAFGNGGSSTDAQDVVHTFMNPRSPARPVPALGLTNDVAVLTALSNDVSFEVVFARQIKAFGRAGDVAIALSTSGGSQNVLTALDQAHAMGLLTVGLAGYGGGRMAESSAVDHLFAVPSMSVHRVQETQTTLTHILWEAVTAALPLPPPDPG